MNRGGIAKIPAVVMAFVIGVAFARAAYSGEKDGFGLQLKKPVRVLYLGDSLTDYDRGSNHVDRLQAKIEKIAPRMVSFYNYSIKGDYITRMLDRFARVKGTYALDRFDGIWGREYDWAFVFLGHNDTYTTSKTDFQKTLVAIEAVAPSYEKLISLLKGKGISRIIIVSPSSSNFELTAAKAQKRIEAIKAGKGGKRNFAVRFGEPKHVEAFMETIRKVAADNGCEFLDVYTEMKAMPDKADLVRSTDGVHLTPKGHEYIAKKTLDYLCGSNCK